MRVALVEDHAATREAFLLALGGASTELTVVGAYESAESFLAASTDTAIDVVLVDLNLGKQMNGVQLIDTLQRRSPGLKCVALTGLADEDAVLDAIRVGACGYLLKDEPTARIINAIHEAAAGEYPVSSRVAGFLFHRASRAPMPVEVSPRERELAACLAEGMSYSDCALQMGVAIGTVQMYVKRLYRKLDVDSKSGVREWFSRYGGTGTSALNRKPSA